MTPEQIQQLKDKFFAELTRKTDGITDFNCMPHNVFEWIKDNILLERDAGKEAALLEISKKALGKSLGFSETTITRVLEGKKAERE